jgi:hypothetical protein
VTATETKKIYICKKRAICPLFNISTGYQERKLSQISCFRSSQKKIKEEQTKT